MGKCDNAFSRVIQKYTKFANFKLLYFQHFTIFYNHFHNFTKFRKLFPTVLKLVSNLKDCVIGPLVSFEIDCFYGLHVNTNTEVMFPSQLSTLLRHLVTVVHAGCSILKL